MKRIALLMSVGVLCWMGPWRLQAEEAAVEPPLPAESPRPEGAAKASAAFIEGLRISAILSGVDGPVVGIIHHPTQSNYLLKQGQTFRDGIEVASIDYEQEAVVLQKGGVRVALFLAGDPNAPAYRVLGASDRPMKWNPNELETEQGPVTLAPAAMNEKYTVVKVSDRSYAIGAEAARSVMNNMRLTDEEKLQALMSYPALVEVGDGEDPIAAAEAAEKKLVPVMPTDVLKKGPPAPKR